MYRFFLCLFLCGVSLSALADPWGVSDGNSFKDKKPKKTLSALISKTLLPQLLARQEPLRYCVEGAPNPEEYASLLEQAYTSWFTSTAQIIRKANRTEEFADLLPFLEKPLLFKRQACSENKIVNDLFHPYVEDDFVEKNFSARREQFRLIIIPPEAIGYACRSEEYDYAEAVACAVLPEFAGSYIVLMSQDKNSKPAQWSSSLLHELGHTLGMGDGYALGESYNSPFFGTHPRKDTLMGTASVQKISCDEADAMVVFADSVSVAGKPARTGQTARRFQSFCTEDPIWYEDGRPQNRSARYTGNNHRFLYTSFEPDGRVKQFLEYMPQASGFVDSFRLTETFPTQSYSIGSMKYYPAQDGRIFVAEESEDNSYKRIFTLRGKHLLGQTFLTRFSKDAVHSSTVLNMGSGKKSLVRIEDIFRVTNHDPYHFVYMLFTGEVKNGKIKHISARTVYALRDWMIVSLIEPDVEATNILLIEKNDSSQGQKIQVYQSNWRDEFLSGGSFVFGEEGWEKKGELSEQDKKYLENIASDSVKQMRDVLSSAVGGAEAAQGGNADVRPVSSKQIYAWLENAVKLYSEMESAVKHHLDDSPFSSDKYNFSAELKTYFRPSFPIQGIKKRRHRE